MKKDSDFFIYHLANEINPLLYLNSTEFSNLSSKKSAYDKINDEDNSELSLNLLGEGIDLEKTNMNPLYEIKDNINLNNNYNNKLFKSKQAFKIHKKIIFKIEKVLKLGRIKKNSSKTGKHDKYQRDNIIRKFKAFLIRNIFNYINKSFNSYKKYKELMGLKKISSVQTKLISKQENLLWLNSQIKDIFSQNLTAKIVSFDKDYNIKLIDKLYKEGKEEKVINILNKTIKELWIVYINDDVNKNFRGFETLKNDIDKLKKSGESEKYIELYVNVAKKFEDIFKEMNPRNIKLRQKEKRIN
jgi:hypothetical protein